MDSQNTYWHDRALLEWQVELGATDAIADAPIDRYALGPQAGKAETKPETAAKPLPPLVAPVAVDDTAVAHQAASQAAQAAADLPALARAIAAFTHCAIKRGARNMVFADGQAGAPVMIIGQAPDRAEDMSGTPFSGASGQLLDRMLAAIDLARAPDDPARAVYLTSALPWRPAVENNPQPSDLALMRPFLERHIALAKPRVVVLMGADACQALLGQGGITNLRGTWTKVQGIACLPMLHPDSLLRNPDLKRLAWQDLLSLNAWLRQ
jgi:uracil-DNA glycosylase